MGLAKGPRNRSGVVHGDFECVEEEQVGEK